MGIPYREYGCMPLGELSDLYDFFMAQEGVCELRSKALDGHIPDVR